MSNMKKATLTLALVAYIAFTPVCFVGASLLAGHHAHDVGTHPVAHTSLPCAPGCADKPISEHLEMYGAVTSSVPDKSVLDLVLLTALYVGVFLCATVYLPKISTQRNVAPGREREARVLCALRQTFLHYIARLTASPNFSYALA